MDHFKALLFDCYGDARQGEYSALTPLLEQKTCPSLEKVFATFERISKKIQAEDPTMIYPAVLKETYLRLAGELRLWGDEDSAQAFASSVGSWPAFPDSPTALEKLKELGFKLAILSNVDNDSFAETRRKLEVGWGELDAAYIAEDIGSYKPDLRNFQYALERLDRDFDISPSEVLIVACSKRADIEPAHRLGLKTVWITREEAKLGVDAASTVRPDWTFETMHEFVEAVEAERDEQLRSFLSTAVRN